MWILCDMSPDNFEVARIDSRREGMEDRTDSFNGDDQGHRDDEAGDDSTYAAHQ